MYELDRLRDQNHDLFQSVNEFEADLESIRNGTVAISYESIEQLHMKLQTIQSKMHLMFGKFKSINRKVNPYEVARLQREGLMGRNMDRLS